MGKLCSFVTCSLILALGNAILAAGGDPDILSDFLVPPGLDPNTITSDSTHTGFRELKGLNFTGRTIAVVGKISMKEFPTLEGQSVSVAALVLPPHSHPRGSELLMLLERMLEVGFVDSKNKLLKQTLQAPDLFIFPKGLVRFQVNTQKNTRGVALGMFGSASAGTVSLPTTIFGSGVKSRNTLLQN